ncbi:MmpS family transport accessory protein [Actinoplanes sp. NPDC051851]|uniref:MmpS family transport accessory protein n=1 Tax=Actinoplanes sp. NPDC051851 TaxID=3154753 RepID=UPI00344A9EB5
MSEPGPDYPPTSEFPPVGRPEPGHQPGYDPTGYQQGHGTGHGTGYPPAYTPAPRRSNAPLVALVLAIGALLCGGIATTGVLLYQRTSDRVKQTTEAIPTALPTQLPTDVPNVPGLGDTEINVVYQVTGDGAASVVWTEKLNELPQQETRVELPWKKKITMSGAAVVSVSAIRHSLLDGSITCRVTIDGEIVSEDTASGPAATATCNKIVIK